ncbi:MAG TPA: pilus assembly protein TadG-related protein [Vicinamibacteria bacterium]|nr:pilus assembly protein TadG-related protein [Vicinamibacteria bacterium]
MKALVNRWRRRERGYVIVTVALVLFVLCGFVAFALDWGLVLSARTASQRAADSGALAGAFTFVTQPFSPQPVTAEQHALEATITNTNLDGAIDPSEVSVTVDVANRRVTVDIDRAEDMYFGRVLGWNQTNVAVRGIAEASAVSTGASCTKPWFIPNSILSGQPSCDACRDGRVFVLPDGTVSPWASTQIGYQFTVKPGNPQNSLAPGQFYAIAMPGSMGGADYRDNIARCAPGNVYCANTYTVELGNMIGPTKQGVLELIGPNPDSYVAVGQYMTQNGLSDTSHQLIVAPIWDECAMPNFCPGGQLPDSGRNLQIPVVGFALLFLEGVQGNDVIARLIWVSGCGGGGGGGGGPGSGPEPPETGPYSIPVRLIRTQ